MLKNKKIELFKDCGKTPNKKFTLVNLSKRRRQKKSTLYEGLKAKN